MDGDDAGETTTAPASDEKAVNPDHISIQVVGQNGDQIFFKINRTTKLQKLLDAYCERSGSAKSSIRFLFDGERVDGDSTAETMGMEDNDIIDAVLQQTGGGPHINLVLAERIHCFFCDTRLDPRTLFKFTNPAYERLLFRGRPGRIFAACLHCAIEHADRFRDVPGCSFARLE